MRITILQSVKKYVLLYIICQINNTFYEPINFYFYRKLILKYYFIDLSNVGNFVDRPQL